MSCTEKELEYARRHRERHPDAVRAATKKWREKNKERHAANLKQWKSENKDRVEASRKKFHALNPNYKKEYQDKWWATMPGRYLKLKITARNKGRSVEITLKEYEDIVSNPCFYCGQPCLSKHGYGIDRTDSSLGYTKENSLPCCKVCNQMKSDMGQLEFIEHVNRIVTMLDVLKREGAIQ